MKYLTSYKNWMKTGEMPFSGLCRCFENDKLLKLFEPNIHSIDNYWFWGTGFDFNTWEHEKVKEYVFTPMRQNIVLFMAAMNGEL